MTRQFVFLLHQEHFADSNNHRTFQSAGEYSFSGNRYLARHRAKFRQWSEHVAVSGLQ